MKSDLLNRIETSLDQIRPFLRRDGGDVAVLRVTELMELQLEFQGNCSTCSMSNMTFKNGIEENIRRDVPEIKKVTAVNISERSIF
jgi:Fe-S cluster biogenesis protein NfuA